MVKDIESALKYYKDSLGFNIRGGAGQGVFGGSVSASIRFGDMTSFELMSVNDTLESEAPAYLKSFLDANEGVRLFALSSSSVDSASQALSGNGFQVDSARSYRNTASVPSGWSRDDGSDRRKSLDFNAEAPPAGLPRLIENIGYDYAGTNEDWKTWYIYTRMFSKHDNGVVGISAIRIVVEDLKKASEEFKKMGLELLAETDSTANFSIKRHQELQLVAAGNDGPMKDFLTNRGEGVFAMRFDVENLDSTTQYFEEELPAAALNKTNDLLTVDAEYAYGVQLEFGVEPADQKKMFTSFAPEDNLSEEALLTGAELYTKYCALCHGDDRQGYAADNAPSLKSKSLLGTSKNNNFMRYTIQFGRANTAMAGYLNTQGGPMEYIEIELLLKYLYEMAEVEDAIDVSREPVLGDIAQGSELYQQNCAICHGKDGEGVSAPALGNPMLLATATDHFLRYAIAEGRDGTPMIAFKDSLSADKIDALTAFLRSRASGWDIPEPDTVTVPTPDEYVLNPDSDPPVFDLKDGKFAPAVQVNQALKENKRMIILDARSEVAWRQMHIPGAIPVPYYEEPENFVNDIPNDGTQIVIYCACPHAASLRVMGTLKRQGYENVAIIDEGILVWAQMGFPVRNGT